MIAAFLLTATLFALPQETTKLFEEANAAYLQGNYAEAVDGFTELINARDLNSPILLYNLANACYKQGQLGKAILNYQAALALDPGFEGARKNLEKVLGETKRSLPLPDPREVSTNPMTRYYPLSPRQSLCVTLFCLFLAIILLVVRQWRPGSKWVWIGRLLLCLAVVFFGLTLAGNNALASIPKLAVVHVGEGQVYFSMNESESPRFLLYEGDRVLVDRVEGDWVRIYAHGGERGWTRKDNLGIVDYKIW